MRPVIVQHKGKVFRGKIELVNDSVVPMSVVVEPKSFQVSEEGELSFQTLDEDLGRYPVGTIEPCFVTDPIQHDR